MEKCEGIEMAKSFSRGEEKGFRFFFENLYPALKYYAFKITNDVPSAEDAVENSFIKIWEKRETFTHHLVIKSWLYTTVRNDCLNKLAVDQRTENRKSEFMYYINSDYEYSVDHNIIRAETIAFARRLVGELPDSCKKIFELLFIHGLTAKQTAAQLKLSVSTVKNQKARGLKVLADMINNSRPTRTEVERKKNDLIRRILRLKNEKNFTFRAIGLALKVNPDYVSSLYYEAVNKNSTIQ